MVARLNLSKKRKAGPRTTRTETRTKPQTPVQEASPATGSLADASGYMRVPEILPGDEATLLKVRLPIRLTNGNTGRGHRWYKSDEFRRECELQLRAWGLVRTPFTVPVVVHVTRVLGPRERLWDSSSLLRGNWKEIEDALVAVGWFQDDGPKWIVQTIPFQVSTSRADGPAVLVHVLKSQAGIAP